MTISFIIKESKKNKKLIGPFIDQIKGLQKFKEIVVAYTKHAGHAIDLAKEHANKIYWM